MRVNIEDDLRAGGRLAKLARVMGWNEREALGALVFFWRATQNVEMIDASSDEIVAEIAVDYDSDEEAKRLIDGMLKAQLLSHMADGKIHINGNDKHVERIAHLRGHAKKGGEARQRIAREKRQPQPSHTAAMSEPYGSHAGAIRQPCASHNPAPAQPYRSAPTITPTPTITPSPISEDKNTKSGLGIPAGPFLLESPSAPSSGSTGKRKAESISPERKAKAKAIHEAFVAGYWQKIGKAPPWGKREWGQLYNLLGSWTPEDLLELVPAFFAWANKDVIRTGYQFGTGPHCFVIKAGELQADILAPKRRAVAAAVEDRERSANRAAATQDQASRVAQKIIEAQHGKQNTGEDHHAERVSGPLTTGGPALRNVQPALVGRGNGDVDRESFAALQPVIMQAPRRQLQAQVHAEPWGGAGPDEHDSDEGASD